MNDNKNKEDVVTNGISFIREHKGIIATFAYLYLIFIGMFSAYLNYIPYNINIFEFATLEDFLLGIFKNFWVFLFGLFIALYSLALILWVEPKFNTKKSWKVYAIYTTISIALFPICIIGLQSINNNAIEIKKHLVKIENFRVKVRLRTGELKDIIDCQSDEIEYYFIGSQGSYIFIFPFNKKEKKYGYNPIIIPISNIAAIKRYESDKIIKKTVN